MNTNELNKLLNIYFQEVNVNVNQNCIIRCKRNYNSKTYEVYYFDFSTNWIKQNLDLNNYLSTIIKTDYYSNPGYLQWNYYFVFLHESDICIEKKIIEENEEFARKFVVKYELLESWLENRFKSSSTSEPVIPSKDLSIIWMEKLKENDLDCVYLDISYEKGFNRFLDKDPIKDSDDIDNSKNFDVKNDKVTHINRLCLERYRKSPKIKTFEFGKVNLIIGNNGSGKTSLLEAIELFICGKNFRNPKKIDMSTSIKVFFKNESFYRDIDLKNVTKYRERDASWYNNVYKNKNNLYISFNRFNFYNTDSALSLSNDRGSSEEIFEAFQEIALGPKVNYINDRLKNFYEKFNSELKRCDKALYECQTTLETETKDLEKLKNNNNLEIFFNIFITELRSIGWKGKVPANYEDLVIFEHDYVILSNSLRKILKNIDWLKDVTQNSLNVNINKLEKLNLEIIATNNKTYALKKEIERLNSVKDLLQYKIDHFNKLKRYFSNKRSIELIGLDEKIYGLQCEASKYQKVIDNTKDIDFSLYAKYKNCTFNELEEKLKKEIAETEEESSSLVTEINNLEINLSKLEKLVTEIRKKGLELISSFSDIHICPLCNTTFEKDEFKKLIREKYENIEGANNLKYYINEHNRIITRLNHLHNNYNNLKLIKNSISVLNDYQNNYDNKLPVILEKLKLAAREKFEIAHKLDELSSLRTHLNANNYFEQEYKLLMEETVKLLRLAPSSITENRIEKEIINFNKHYEDTISQISECNYELIEQNKLRKEISYQFSNNSTSENLEHLIQKKLETINESLLILQSTSDLITVHPNEPIIRIQRKLDLLYSIFEKFKDEKRQNDTTELIIERGLSKITECNEKISELTERKAILQHGYSTIECILDKFGKEKYLQSFLDENKKEILNIFKMIHAPREFENINFNEELHIVLERENSEGDAELSTISTGQRSALALSIFLCLNKKLQNGPPFLIFDDPIAYIDDLNILSFIDYLREIALNTNRQIFFATANENLAFLFHQKFGFLDTSEFKIYKLTT